ncbi:unnamed protein product [Lampetra fluviatilis]
MSCGRRVARNRSFVASRTQLLVDVKSDPLEEFAEKGDAQFPATPEPRSQFTPNSSKRQQRQQQRPCKSQKWSPPFGSC